MKALEPQVGFRFRVLYPDGRIEPMLVDAERALIGSAAHCEVRLPPEITTHEHVEVVASQGIVYFSTRAIGLASTLPMLDGVSTPEGQWAPQSVLGIGDVRITVEVVNLAAPKGKAPTNAIAAAFALVVFSIAAVAFAHGPKEVDMAIPDAPALLPPKGAVQCPAVASDQRSALAAEKLRVGLAKRERSPFSPHDGFEAVIHFETAASCFKLQSQQADFEYADHAADALRERLEEDYRLRRVRLEHAFRLRDAVLLKRELVVLIPMTAHYRGPYTDWLGMLDRVATAQLAQKGRIL